MSAYDELLEYVGNHKDTINDVAKKLEHGETVDAESVIVYATFKQLTALSDMEAEERAAEATARLQLERERYERELEHSQEVFDNLVAKSLEWFENVE